MSKTRKIIFLLFCLVMAASVFTACGEQKELSYELNDSKDGYIVTGLGNYKGTDIVISDTYNDLPVVAIGHKAFYDCSTLTSITIPDSVTEIYNYAFKDCSALTSITIPESVTKIHNYAFFGCSGLTGITIPDSVTSIGKGAFYNCSSLTSIDISDNVTSISYRTFSNCSSLTSITIPDNVTSIGDSAFSGCSALSKITVPFIGATKDGTDNTNFGYIFGDYIPESLNTVVVTGGTSIVDNAFYGCSTLTSITIPDSVTSIGNSAFSGCTALASITIPSSVTSIGNSAFYDYDNLMFMTVYYGGNVDDWNKITIFDENNYLIDATRYYYSDSKPTDTANNYWHYVNGVQTAW